MVEIKHKMLPENIAPRRPILLLIGADAHAPLYKSGRVVHCFQGITTHNKATLKNRPQLTRPTRNVSCALSEPMPNCCGK